MSSTDAPPPHDPGHSTGKSLSSRILDPVPVVNPPRPTTFQWVMLLIRKNLSVMSGALLGSWLQANHPDSMAEVWSLIGVEDVTQITSLIGVVGIILSILWSGHNLMLTSRSTEQKG